jgi:tungstate transport system substrate-binding protein
MFKFLALIIFLLFTFTSFANVLKIATTTSIENSGLLVKLIDPFEKKYKTKILTIPVGTGRAIQLAKNGDVDLIIVHSPEDELKFVKDGFGIKRKEFMYNYFILVGFKNAKEEKDIFSAFAFIKNNKKAFISRGDSSGTHKRELSIWKKINYEPKIEKDKWYLETGQGMAMTLLIAFEKKAYTLTDIATFLFLKNKIDLKIVVNQSEILYNSYSAIMVNPEKHSHINYKDAKIFINWLTGKEGQGIIKNYKINNAQVFYVMPKLNE